MYSVKCECGWHWIPGDMGRTHCGFCGAGPEKSTPDFTEEYKAEAYRKSAENKVKFKAELKKNKGLMCKLGFHDIHNAGNPWVGFWRYCSKCDYEEGSQPTVPEIRV